MSKDEWIAQKIAKLIDEGKSKDEAAAIANSMWDEEHADKELSAAVNEPAVDATPAPEVEAVTVAADPVVVAIEGSEAHKALLDRIWDGIQQKLGLKSDDARGFKVAGNHWLAVWSNNFKDRDGEIFTAKAMADYAARVDMGITPVPELWVWHAGKQVAIGAADWVSTHNHFLVASGSFYGSETAQRAKAYYTKHAKDTGISHGFTYPSTEYDGKHYHAFNTFEISLLPRGSEANWFTSLEGVKAMALDEKKVKYLKDVFGEDHATKILADWEARGKALEELGVEFKDFTAADPQDVTVAANKEAVEHADKAFSELLADVLENSAEPVTAALEAVKAVKEARAEIQTQNGVIETLRKEIDVLRSEMELRPRMASQDAQTAIKESSLPEAVQQAIADQRKVIDPFWGEVASSNGNHGG